MDATAGLAKRPPAQRVTRKGAVSSSGSDARPGVPVPLSHRAQSSGVGSSSSARWHAAPATSWAHEGVRRRQTLTTNGSYICRSGD
jgi:hypothetical protein